MVEAVVDACCLINLYAATDGDLASLVPSLGMDLYVPPAVLAESRLLWKVIDEERVEIPIDLKPVVEARLLHPCDAGSPEELALYVELAIELDDGEAMCLAIAKSRGWTIATDDRKTLRIAKDLGVPCITTPDLMRRWADSARLGDQVVAQALRNIQNNASFFPRRTSALFEWWSKLVDD